MPDDFPPDAFVVRCGQDTCTPQSLRDSALRHFRDSGHSEYGVSVLISPGMSPLETAVRGKCPNPKFRFTTASEVVAAGFAFSPRWNRRTGHTDILLKPDFADKDLVRLSECFVGLAQNPYPAPRRKR